MMNSIKKSPDKMREEKTSRGQKLPDLEKQITDTTLLIRGKGNSGDQTTGNTVPSGSQEGLCKGSRGTCREEFLISFFSDMRKVEKYGNYKIDLESEGQRTGRRTLFNVPHEMRPISPESNPSQRKQDAFEKKSQRLLLS